MISAGTIVVGNPIAEKTSRATSASNAAIKRMGGSAKIGSGAGSIMSTFPSRRVKRFTEETFACAAVLETNP